MTKNKIAFFLLSFLPCYKMMAQYQLPIEVQNAVTLISKSLKPDHQSQFLEVKVIDNNPLKISVETTSKDAVQKLDSLLPNISKKVNYLPMEMSDGKIFGITNLSVANHRGTPAQSGEMWTQSLLGTVVRILKKTDNGYFLVQSPDGYISYTEPASIFPVTEIEKQSWESAPKIIYTQFYGHILSDPNKDAIPVSDIVAGDILVMDGKKGKYYHVKFPDGREGYVSKKESEKIEDWVKNNKPNYKNILSTAEKLMGVPYLWGGTSIKGVDCSGYMRTSFFLNGILLPRDASQQARIGEPIDIYENGIVSIPKSLKKLQQGDLLFFGDKRADGSDHVTHVAMYMENGKFIQASGMVKISDFSSEAADYDAYHMPMFLSARRVLNQIGSLGITLVK